MMSEPRADVALLVDFTDLRHSLCPDASALRPDPVADQAAAGDAGASEDAGHPTATEVARHLVRFASQVGRVAMARAYADWSRCADLCREVATYNLEPILVPGTGDGEDRSHIRLVVDALEALYTGDEPDAFILVTGDATLLPLVQKLRADGSEVIILGPSHAVPQELKASADRYYPLEDVLDGVEAAPARPRTWRNNRSSAAQQADPDTPAGPSDNGPEGRRDRPPHPTPVRCEAGFDGYDWEPFVRLIDELEHRLPFVGVRYLVNKVLAAHNCGVEDPRLKRDLINRAVDDDLIEMYPVPNLGNRADPVTACRLNRVSVRIVGILGKTNTPEAPPEHESEHGGDGEAADGGSPDDASGAD